jgi:hypothetical protein
MIADLVSIAWKKDGWYLAALTDSFQAVVQLAA